MYRAIKGVGFGDVHFGHSSTKAEKILTELIECFPYGKWASSLDVCVIDGDWYDKLLPNNHEDSFITERSIFYMLNWAKDHDIVLFVVDGTPLHDSGQIQKFIHINEEAKIGAELTLVDDIDIVYNSKFGMNVLFVPDRPRTSPEETYQIVLDKLQQKGLSHVNMAVMHGTFQYQLPEIAASHKHVEENYAEIVKGPIIIGHIHKHSSKGNIIAPGSFSRLTHGEEEPKGFVEFVLQPSGEFTAKFIENENATIYKTINVSKLSLDESYEKIERVTRGLIGGSRVRIECEQGHPISLDKTFMVLKMKYDCFTWSIKVNADKSVIAPQDDVFSADNDYVPLVINKHNMPELIVDKLTKKGYPPETVKLVSEFLPSWRD